MFVPTHDAATNSQETFRKFEDMRVASLTENGSAEMRDGRFPE